MTQDPQPGAEVPDLESPVESPKGPGPVVEEVAQQPSRNPAPEAADGPDGGLVDGAAPEDEPFEESASEATQLLAGSGEVLSSAREPAFRVWLVRAMPAPAASAPAPSWPSGDSVAAARKAPAGTRARVCSRSQAESTPGILSAKNSASASAPEVPSTHQDCVACSAGGSSTQPSTPARPTPNTVR